MIKPRLILAEHEMLMVDGLCSLLSPDYEIVAAVGDRRALVVAAAQHQPDLTIIDLQMPLLSGLEAARQMKKADPNAKIVAIGVESDADFVREAFCAGVAGYVLKRSSISELLTAIDAVLRGCLYISPLVARHVVNFAVTGTAQHGSRFGSLTPRQREVLRLIAEGYSAKQIASVFHISTKTVEAHKASLMEKVGLHTTAELTRYALEHGLIGSIEPQISALRGTATDSRRHRHAQHSPIPER